MNSIVAASVLAAIGDITRFSSPEKLVSYLGLNPSVHSRATVRPFMVTSLDRDAATRAQCL